jgi:hypothetical protein
VRGATGPASTPAAGRSLRIAPGQLTTAPRLAGESA